MAGIEERVKGFLESWPIVEKHLKLLEEEIEDGNKLFDSEGSGRLSQIETFSDLSEG
jgi:hypothetical protein